MRHCHLQMSSQSVAAVVPFNSQLGAHDNSYIAIGHFIYDFEAKRTAVRIKEREKYKAKKSEVNRILLIKRGRISKILF